MVTKSIGLEVTFYVKVRERYNISLSLRFKLYKTKYTSYT